MSEENKPNDSQQRDSAADLRRSLIDKMQGGGASETESTPKPAEVSTRQSSPVVTPRGATSQAEQSAEKKPSLMDRIRQYEVLDNQGLLHFTEEMTLLLEVGVPMVRALDLISKRTVSKSMRKVAASLKEQVQSGSTLAEAMGDWPLVFSRYYQKSIEAGEESGRVVTSLKILSSYLEREINLNSQLRFAALYPAVTGSLALILGLGIFLFVVPAFAEMYVSNNMELPAATSFIYSASLFVQNFLPLILFLLVVLVGLGIAQYRYRLIPDLTSRIFLRLPITHGIIEKITVYRFSRVMSMLLKSGLPLLTSVRLSAEIIPLEDYREPIRKVSKELENGRNLSDALHSQDVFPEIIGDMVAVGEEVGSLEKVFDRIAANYEGDIDNLFDSITSIIEPAMNLFVGGFVMLIALALFLPYVSLSSVFELQ